MSDSEEVSVIGEAPMTPERSSLRTAVQETRSQVVASSAGLGTRPGRLGLVIHGAGGGREPSENGAQARLRFGRTVNESLTLAAQRCAQAHFVAAGSPT
jgi:hypothetical protein